MTIITTCIAEISHPDNLYVDTPCDSTSILEYFGCSLIFRTKIYNYISGFYLLASFLGSLIASLLLSHHVYFLNCLSAVCFILTAMMAMLVPSHCGRDSQLAADAVPILSSVEDDESPKETRTLDKNQVIK